MLVLNILKVVTYTISLCTYLEVYTYKLTNFSNVSTYSYIYRYASNIFGEGEGWEEQRNVNNSERPVDALAEKDHWPTHWQLEIKRC